MPVRHPLYRILWGITVWISLGFLLCNSCCWQCSSGTLLPLVLQILALWDSLFYCFHMPGSINVPEAWCADCVIQNLSLLRETQLKRCAGRVGWIWKQCIVWLQHAEPVLLLAEGGNCVVQPVATAERQNLKGFTRFCAAREPSQVTCVF